MIARKKCGFLIINYKGFEETFITKLVNLWNNDVNNDLSEWITLPSHTVNQMNLIPNESAKKMQQSDNKL